ncbi:hypothetical protein PO909_008663 [Leuciscus waleckii]
MAAADVEDFIGQNRLLSDFIETFRGVSESDKHWKSRREFLFRNISNYEEKPRVDHLLALSMVWANHVFLGCRYSPDLLEKVGEMAEGIVVEDAPVFKTRDELIKQQQQRVNRHTHTHARSVHAEEYRDNATHLSDHVLLQKSYTVLKG